LLEARKPYLGCFFSNKVFSVDDTNVLGGLCSFGASIELVKKRVSEMYIFLNLILQSFDPKNFVPLVQIGKFQKGLIEQKESYKIVYCAQPTCNSCWKKSSKTKPHERMHQPNRILGEHWKGVPSHQQEIFEHPTYARLDFQQSQPSKQSIVLYRTWKKTLSGHFKTPTSL
jgi:hypothetical protein